MTKLIECAKSFQETEDLTELLYLALSEERRKEWESSMAEYRGRMAALKDALSTAQTDTTPTEPPTNPAAPVVQSWPHNPPKGG